MVNKENESIQKLNELLTKEKIMNSNNIDKITDKIYLGCEEGAKEYDFLKTEKINNIISIIPEIPKFPDEYLNWKRSGKGKEYDEENNLIFDGEYLNGHRWNGKGKEYEPNGNLIFECEYIKGEEIKNQK